MTSMKQVRWKLIGWLFVLSAVAYLDRVNISIAGKLMAREYNLSNQQLPERFAGAKVRVTGTLDAKTKTIAVDSIRRSQ